MLVGLIPAVVSVIAGCAADHRISLDQFIAEQQRMYEALPPDAAPQFAEDSAAVLDRQLGALRLGPDDVVAITLNTDAVADQRPPFPVRIDDAGEIDLPIVGAIHVAGLTLQEAEDAVRAAYVPAVLRDVSVYVELFQAQTTNVLVIGAVSAPGLVQLRRSDRDLLHAIVGAGGVSQAASGKATLRRIRRPHEEITLDLTDPTQLRAAVTLDPLQDGDIVTVQAATPNTVFVGGLVNFPRPQSYGQGVKLNVLQAIAASGGVRPDLSPGEGTLIRRMPDGHDVHVRLDLDRIAMGADPNIELAAGDILWVPHTLETRILEFVNRNFFLRAGASVTYTATAADFLNSNAERQAVGSNLEQTFDPYGALLRNSALQQLSQPAPPP
jgi:polysaccharide export outer membrane protein